MRTIVYSAAVSLDGFIHAGDDDRYEWIRNGPKADAMMHEVFAGVDTILMGRKTLEVARELGGLAAFGDVDFVVFSRTLTSVAEPRTRVVRDDPEGFVRELKQGPSGRIFLMGGAGLAAQFIRAGLVDELALAIQPLLLGGGIPLITPLGERVPLTLVDSAPLDEGAVRLLYRLGGGASITDASDATAPGRTSV